MVNLVITIIVVMGMADLFAGIFFGESWLIDPVVRWLFRLDSKDDL